MKRFETSRVAAFLIITFSLLSTVSAQWIKQNSGVSVDLHGIMVIDTLTAVAVGGDGTILKTTDAGGSWTQKECGTTANLNALAFKDHDRGIAVGDHVFCRTSNGGETWDAFPADWNLISVDYSQFWALSRIYIGAQEGKLLFSDDDGVAWKDTSFQQYYSYPIVAVGLNDCTPSLSSDMAVAASLLFTAETFLPPDWNLYSNDLNMLDELSGGELDKCIQYLVGGYGDFVLTPLILRKTVTDTVWEKLNHDLPFPFIPSAVCSYYEKVFVCGNDGRIFFSDDTGKTWTEQFTQSVVHLNAINFLTDKTGYAVGDSGTIYFTDNGGVTGVSQSIPTKENFYLFQNYPNPCLAGRQAFNPAITIRYSIHGVIPSRRTGASGRNLPASGSQSHNNKQITASSSTHRSENVSLIVYDILGREVTTLVNERQEVGNYEVQFNAGNLPSGVYIYRLKAGNFSDSKKFLLLK